MVDFATLFKSQEVVSTTLVRHVQKSDGNILLALTPGSLKTILLLRS